MAEIWLNPTDAFAHLKPEKSVLCYSPQPPARWSYLCVNPFIEFKARGATCIVNGKKDPRKPLQILKKLFEIHRTGKKRLLKGPPFQGGMVGYLSYEAAHYLEFFPKTKVDDVVSPWLHFLFFDHGLAFDHHKKKVHPFGPDEKTKTLLKTLATKNKKKHRAVCTTTTGNITSSFTQKKYVAAVNAIQNKIASGETYQANLSQRFSAQTTLQPWNIFVKLNHINPSPYAAYFTTPEMTIASASPELLFSISKNRIVTRPIAGTRPRGKTTKQDTSLEKELKQSAKENAEHAMLVDLERNDVGKICAPGSVKVAEEFAVEKYSHVQHLVSQVEGTLLPEKNAFDAIRALFPGGTITGCPKVRTMQILSEIEPVARGPYTGSLGWIGWNGDAAFNILIRSIYFKADTQAGRKAKRTAYFHAGGGIVADSVPEKEFRESLDKAKAMRQALT